MLSRNAMQGVRAQRKSNFGLATCSRRDSLCHRKPTHCSPGREQLVSFAAAVAMPSASVSAASSSSAASTATPAPQPLSAAELLDERLYEEIRACEAWADVLDVVVDEGSTMSTKRVVQALTRFGALLKGPAAMRERTQAIQTPEFKLLMQLVFGKVSTLKANQACAVTLTLSQLGVKPTRPQLVALFKVIESHAPQLTARDVATVMHGAVSLGTPPAIAERLFPVLSKRARAILRATRQAGSSDGPAGAPSTSDATSGATVDATAGATAQQPEQQPSQQQHQGAAQGHDAFTPQGLSMMLGSAAHMKYDDHKLVTAVVEAALKQLPDFAPQGVANLLWATASLNRYHPDLINASLSFFAARRTSFKAQETSNIAWALTRLRHHPQQYGQALTLAILSQPQGALRSADVSSLLGMLAMFCIVPGKQAVDQICARLDVLLPSCTASELCNCLWALGLMGETARPQFARIAAMLPPHFERDALDDSHLRQTFQALLCATLSEATALEQQGQGQGQATPSPSSSSTSSPASPSASSSPSPAAPSTIPSFPPLMLDTMKRLWVSTIQKGVKAAASETSPTKMVSEAVEKLRVRHDAARATKDGLVLIDVALRPSDSRFVAMQILRTGADLTRNTDQLLGPVQLERQILEKNGWEVKYLLQKDLQEVAPEAQLFFIAEYLKSIGCRVQKAVAAPGAKAPAASASAPRTSMAPTSEAAREAGMLLNDPRLAADRGRKPRR